MMLLEGIGKEMNVQDNRSTHFPVFIIQEKKKIYKENGGERERADYDLADANDLCEKCRVIYDETADYPEECDDCPSYCFVQFDREWVPNLRPGFFFTEAACHEHIANNSYHYAKEVRTYAIGVWRNPELMEVMQYLSMLADPKTEARDCYKQ